MKFKNNSWSRWFQLLKEGKNQNFLTKSENRMIEYVDHLHEHFKSPPKMGPSKYYPPTDPGYSTEMFPESVDKFSYPNGEIWKDLFSNGKYQDRSRIHKRLV